jgi:hypothetical protein
VETAHLIAAIAVLATNLVAGAWGGASWLRRAPSVGFWYALRVAQLAVVVQVLLGAILLLSGREAPDGLHYLYGVLPLVVTLIAEGIRAGVAEHELSGLDFGALPEDRKRLVVSAIVRRETGVMAVSALIVLFLALRAAETSAGLL